MTGQSNGIVHNADTEQMYANLATNTVAANLIEAVCRPTPDSFRVLLRRLVFTPAEFTLKDLQSAVQHISTVGATTPSQLGAWLTAIRWHQKDRDPAFLALYANLTRAKALNVNLPNRSADAWVVDIVGTGGDGHDTFNASTAAAIVAAGVEGVRVCKVRFLRWTSRRYAADGFGPGRTARK